MMSIRMPLIALTALVATPMALAQWDPDSGDWGKSDPTDIRVMSWNVEDGICSTNTKTDAINNWNALVRIVASLQPDVLIIQEAGDNSGNGSGSGVDSVTNLETTLGLFFAGGADPFQGGSVGSYVQLFVPGFDMPFVRVSTVSDSYNRNVVLSRFPFADLNGDGTSELDNFVLIPDAWQSGGNAGIRGWSHVEIDLPDDTYTGDLVVGNSHMKAGGHSNDYNQRDLASQNISYFIQYFFNGNQTGSGDPNNAVVFPTANPSVLDDNTPVIWGGDLNERPGSSSPDAWMRQGGVFGGSDGTDRDGTDSTSDSAAHPISGQTHTQGSSSKLDYLVWQDSIATARRQFVFSTTGSGMTIDKVPEPARSFPGSGLIASGLAADHFPVVIDFILPLGDLPCPADINGDGFINLSDVTAFIDAFILGDPIADINEDGFINIADVTAFIDAFLASTGVCP